MILAVDIGTTSMKIGAFRIVDGTLELVRQFSQEYKVNIYNEGLCGDIEQEKWDKAFGPFCGFKAFTFFTHRLARWYTS